MMSTILAKVMMSTILAKVSSWCWVGAPPLLALDAVVDKAFPYGTLGSAAILAWHLIYVTKVERPRQEKERAAQVKEHAAQIKEQVSAHATQIKEQSERYEKVLETQTDHHRRERDEMKEERIEMRKSIDRLCEAKSGPPPA